MENLFEIAALFVVLTNFMLLSSSRLASCIRAVAFQGMALGLLIALSHSGAFGYRALFLIVAAVGVKGIIFPVMLTRTLTKVGVRREVEPYVGYSLSILAGVAGLLLSFWMGSRLPVTAVSRLAVPVAFSTMLTGLFLIISRKKALTQVMGYLTMENGIFLFGVLAVHAQSLWVELGILLDLFVAVFVMGIAIYNIKMEFESTDVDRFDNLTG